MPQIPPASGILGDIEKPISFEKVETAKQNDRAFSTVQGHQFLPKVKWFDNISYTTVSTLTENNYLLVHIAGPLISEVKHPREIFTRYFRSFKDIQLELKTIKSKIEFREEFPGEISDFLLRNEKLLPLITNSIPTIENVFSSPKLVAEVIKDPEESQMGQLIIFIKTTLSVDETLEKIEQLDRQIGESVYDKSERRILFMEEFE
jgi:hypothetical protein